MSSKSRSNKNDGSSSLGWNGGRKMPARRRSRVIIFDVVSLARFPCEPINLLRPRPEERPQGAFRRTAAGEHVPFGHPSRRPRFARAPQDEVGVCCTSQRQATHKNRVGQLSVRHMCEEGVLSQPSPSFGCRKLRPIMSVNSSSSTLALGSNE